jgi:hypothetical protein
MTLRIELTADSPKKILRLSGRIQSEDLDALREAIGDGPEATILQLGDLTLVDAEAVRFLAACEARGVELQSCPPYIRDWILRERAVE